MEGNTNPEGNVRHNAPVEEPGLSEPRPKRRRVYFPNPVNVVPPNAEEPQNQAQEPQNQGEVAQNQAEVAQNQAEEQQIQVEKPQIQIEHVRPVIKIEPEEPQYQAEKVRPVIKIEPEEPQYQAEEPQYQAEEVRPVIEIPVNNSEDQSQQITEAPSESNQLRIEDSTNKNRLKIYEELITELEAKCAGKDDKLKQLQEDSAKKDDDLKEQVELIANLRENSAKKDCDLKEQVELIANLRENSAKKDCDLKKQAEKLKEQVELIAKLQEDSEKKDCDLKGQAEKLEEQDILIAKFQEDSAKKDEDLAKKDCDLKEKDEKLKDQGILIKQVQEDSATKSEKLKKQDILIKQVQEESTQKDCDLEGQGKKLEEHVELIAKLQEDFAKKAEKLKKQEELIAKLQEDSARKDCDLKGHAEKSEEQGILIKQVQEDSATKAKKLEGQGILMKQLQEESAQKAEELNKKDELIKQLQEELAKNSDQLVEEVEESAKNNDQLVQRSSQYYSFASLPDYSLPSLPDYSLPSLPDYSPATFFVPLLNATSIDKPKLTPGSKLAVLKQLLVFFSKKERRSDLPILPIFKFAVVSEEFLRISCFDVFDVYRLSFCKVALQSVHMATCFQNYAYSYGHQIQLSYNQAKDFVKLFPPSQISVHFDNSATSEGVNQLGKVLERTKGEIAVTVCNDDAYIRKFLERFRSRIHCLKFDAKLLQPNDALVLGTVDKLLVVNIRNLDSLARIFQCQATSFELEFHGKSGALSNLSDADIIKIVSRQVKKPEVKHLHLKFNSLRCELVKCVVDNLLNHFPNLDELALYAKFNCFPYEDSIINAPNSAMKHSQYMHGLKNRLIGNGNLKKLKIGVCESFYCDIGNNGEDNDGDMDKRRESRCKAVKFIYEKIKLNGWKSKVYNSKDGKIVLKFSHDDNGGTQISINFGASY